MEDELWKELYPMIVEQGKHRPAKATFTDGQIVATFMWSVLHDRPVSWACRRSSWPIHLRGSCRPSPATMSRRLRTDSVQRLLRELNQHITAAKPASLCRWIDAKPLPIGGSSQDVQAGYGRSSGGKAKGYKLFAIADRSQGFIAWRVGPMNASETTMADGLIERLDSEGYLVGDGMYDCNRLYDLCSQRGVQFFAPRRYPGSKGIGHHRHSPHRLRALGMLDSPTGLALLKHRAGIERMFAQLTNFACGLTPLPNWVRTQLRVELWVCGKMILYHLWRTRKKTA